MDDTQSGRAQRRRIWILTRHYPPDVGALSYRLEHLAGVLSRDYEVTVLASQPNRYARAPKAPKRERSGDVTIRRISSMQVLRSRGKAGRLLTEMLGAISMALVALRHRRKIDVALSSTPPFFYAIAGLAMKRLGRRSLVFDMRDLWLDWAEETGLIRSRLLRRALRGLESATIRAADHITLATEGFRRIVIERHGIPPDRATVVYNGLDDELLPGEPIVARRVPGDPLQVLYAGNLGPSQNLAALREGLTSSLDRWDNLTVTVVGDGAQRDDLTGLHPRLEVLPHVGRSELAKFYTEADAFLIHLADLDVYQHTVPSKVFEYSAYGRPLLCGVRGEAREIAKRHADCFVFESEDRASLASAIDRLCNGEPPDNEGDTRADRTEILRSTRSPIWLDVFGSIP